MIEWEKFKMYYNVESPFSNPNMRLNFIIKYFPKEYHITIALRNDFSFQKFLEDKICSFSILKNDF